MAHHTSFSTEKTKHSELQCFNENKFKQQKLPAFQPILTSRNMMPVFFGIGTVFVLLGILMHITFGRMKEYTYDYTDCADSTNASKTCAEFFMDPKNRGKTCLCTHRFKLEKFDEEVFVYYGLSNFYQNHRRYVRSRDDAQLNGQDVDPRSLALDCDPYKTVRKGELLGYAPCGAIANSIFNDTFAITYSAKGSNKTEKVGLLSTEIAWQTDRDFKFNNPSSWSGFTAPRNWNVSVWELDPAHPANNGYENEDLIVWMRTAALPDFRKLYRRVDHRSNTFKDGLPAGVYKLTIRYNFPVTAFDGRKSIIIATVSWLGGKNSYLGMAYMMIGGLAILQGFVFAMIEFCWGRKSNTTDVITKSKSDLTLAVHPLSKKKSDAPDA